MIVEKDLRRLFNQLISNNVAHIELSGANVTVRIFDDASKVSFSTPIYLGGNFIPKSVRHCVSHKAPFDDKLFKTFVSIDEPNYKISLNYLGVMEGFDNQTFKKLLEEYTWLAEEWRYYLDEHDKNDLIHVRVK
jgi:hypothetical protein